jgi:hypothetical protein
MNTIEMEVVLMRHFSPRQNIVVPNVSWGMSLITEYGWQPLHECDLIILSKSNYATEVEIKISKADLLADKKKLHRHRHNHIARLFFAVPDCLVDFAIENIPERAGLYSAKKGEKPRLIKQCKRNSLAQKWTDKDRLKLAHLGTMRIAGLKDKIAKLQAKT